MTHGASSTLAQTVKTARFLGPSGLALDSKGNIYVVEGGKIRKITPDGSVSTLAGGGPDRGGPDGRETDGTGNEARFENPYYIAVDSTDNLYVTALFGDRIRKISPAGVVSTVTKGTEGKKFASIAVDSAGTIYFADHGFVGKITSDGTVARLAGKYPPTEKPVDGTADAAGFPSLGGLAVDNVGNVYVTDGYTIRKITPAGVVTTIAGTSAYSGRGHVDGPGSAARFYDPRDIAVDNANNLYVSDKRTIRKITPDGVVGTVAGKPEPGFMFREGGFERPSGLAVDKAGNIYVADADAAVIRKITAAGVVSTLAGKYKINDEEQERAIQEDENRRHGR